MIKGDELVELTKKIETYSLHILGIESRERDPNDPDVALAVDNALAFVGSIASKLDTPSVHAGVISDPAIILILSWPMASLAGVHVYFKGPWCDVEWTDGVSSRMMENLTFSELLIFDVAQKVRVIGERAKRPPPDCDM